MRDKTLIIAEAGVNHNGSLDTALNLVNVAAQSGADIVKFQSFKSKKLVTNTAEKAEYQIKNTGSAASQQSMLKKLELSVSDHLRLFNECKALNIEFLSTPFEQESLEFLVNNLRLHRLKIPSGEITNAPLLLKFAQSGCEIILSTGMSTLSEIEVALGVLAFGMTQEKSKSPSLRAFQQAYNSDEGQAALRAKVSLLHCTTEYPAPIDEINLRVIDTLNAAFQLPVGYSDHSEGIFIPIAAVAKGAKIIEKHFTLDRNMEGPDHVASLEPNELKEMVSQIRLTEKALGSSTKLVTGSEEKNMTIARKSLVAAKAIKKGEIFSEDNLTVKRPGSGITPLSYWSYIGWPANQDYEEDQVIE